MARYTAILGAFLCCYASYTFCWLDSLRERFQFSYHGEGQNNNPEDYGRPPHHPEGPFHHHGGPSHNFGGPFHHPGGSSNHPGGRFNHPGGQFNHPGGQFNHHGGQFNHPGGQFNHPGGSFNHPGESSNFPGGPFHHAGGPSNHPGGSSSGESGGPVVPASNDWPFVKRANPVSYQSPINIDTKKVRAVQLPTLEWHLLWDIDEEDVVVLNNGRTVEVEISHNEHKPYMVGGPLTEPYVFEQMHFHWGKDLCGSEHWINGKCYPTEVHLLHYNKKYGSAEEAQKHPDGLAVITFFGKKSNYDNPDLKPLLKALNYIIEPNTQVRKTFGREFKFLKKHMDGQKYFAAPGSLTTPPFSESVTWIFFLDMFDISRDQLAQLRRLKSDNGHIEITKNTRELQPHNGRPIIKPLTRDAWGNPEDEIVVVED